MAEAGELTLLYGDESHVSPQGSVPYGGQFPGEDVFVPIQKGFRLNCWGLFSRDNQCHRAITRHHITAAFVAAFVAEKSDTLSRQITGLTVIVLGNANIYSAHLLQQRRGIWAQRDLHLFFLPLYSPRLNWAETGWPHPKRRMAPTPGLCPDRRPRLRHQALPRKFRNPAYHQV